QGRRAGPRSRRRQPPLLPAQPGRPAGAARLPRQILGSGVGGVSASGGAGGARGAERKTEMTATDLNAVRKSITERAPQATAFRVFTEGMATWWRLETHHIGKAAPQTIVIEPRVGGRCYERGVDGSECVWGRVLLWEPPARYVFTWEISADFQIDPALKTEVE